MRKKGGALVFVGIVAIIFVVILLVAGIYFYNFYVFKSVRICVGDATGTTVSCGVTQDCVDIAEIVELNIYLEDAPSFVQENFQRILDEVVYCDETCFIRKVRGINFESQELEVLDSCEEGEIELVIEIRGKDAFEIWRWMESRKA
ncbi:MAG: hypothetical protein ABIF18_00825 [archaeon]